jgi:hypothetical protein
METVKKFAIYKREFPGIPMRTFRNVRKSNYFELGGITMYQTFLLCIPGVTDPENGWLMTCENNLKQ